MVDAEKSAAVAGALFFFCAGAECGTEVRIEGYKYFRAVRVTIKAGDSVRWINLEKRTSHSVVFPAKADWNRIECSLMELPASLRQGRAL
jgi:plastocyanin